MQSKCWEPFSAAVSLLLSPKVSVLSKGTTGYCYSSSGYLMRPSSSVEHFLHYRMMMIPRCLKGGTRLWSDLNGSSPGSNCRRVLENTGFRMTYIQIQTVPPQEHDQKEQVVHIDICWQNISKPQLIQGEEWEEEFLWHLAASLSVLMMGLCHSDAWYNPMSTVAQLWQNR